MFTIFETCQCQVFFFPTELVFHLLMTKLEKGRANSFTASSAGEPCRLVQLSQSLGHKDLEHRFPSDMCRVSRQTQAVFPFIPVEVYQLNSKRREEVPWHGTCLKGHRAVHWHGLDLEPSFSRWVRWTVWWLPSVFNNTEKILHSNPHANVWIDALSFSQWTRTGAEAV